MPKKLDWAGALIVNLHQMLGHDKAAAYLGQPSNDTNTCILCMRDRGEAAWAEVLERLGI